MREHRSSLSETYRWTLKAGCKFEKSSVPEDEDTEVFFDEGVDCYVFESIYLFSYLQG